MVIIIEIFRFFVKMKLITFMFLFKELSVNLDGSQTTFDYYYVRNKYETSITGSLNNVYITGLEDEVFYDQEVTVTIAAKAGYTKPEVTVRNMPSNAVIEQLENGVRYVFRMPAQKVDFIINSDPEESVPVCCPASWLTAGASRAR